MVESVTDPDDWREPGDDVSIVYRQLGPWRCPVCGGITWKPYRCDAPASDDGAACGADLAERGGTEKVRFDPGVTD